MPPLCAAPGSSDICTYSLNFNGSAFTNAPMLSANFLAASLVLVCFSSALIAPLYANKICLGMVALLFPANFVT